jgi:hypothetical protein
MLKVFAFKCTSKLYIQGKIFSKIPEIVIQLPDYKHNIWLYVQVYKF